MKSIDYSRYFNPLVIFLAIAGGMAITSILFIPFFKIDCSKQPQNFYCLPEFSTWIILFMVLWCMLILFLIPGWATFIWLYKRHFIKFGAGHSWQVLIQLLIISIIIAISGIAIGPSLNPAFQNTWTSLIPEYVRLFVINITTLCFFIVALPYGLGMFLIYLTIHELAAKIQAEVHPKKSRSLEIINEIFLYRKTLQTFLVIAGILLSMIPVTGIALRSIVISEDPFFAQMYPIAADIYWGLAFTLLLLIIYVPTSLELSAAARHLRDVVVPINSIDALRTIMEKRKALDDLLQAQMNYSSILSGIVTLAPLLVSVLGGFLGFKG